MSHQSITSAGQNPSYLEEPQVAFLSRVLDDVKNGNILVPRFQRRFVWTDEDRLLLFKSVRDGLPIGSLLVWRTSAVDLDTFPRIGGIEVPASPQPTPGASRQYLLDGHQRISTLFSALTFGAQRSNAAEEEFGITAGDVYCDLSDRSFQLVRTGRHPEPHWLPLNILFNSVELLKFQRSLNDDKYVETVDLIANRFRNYKIALIPLVTDDLEAATTAFQRINSSGRKMDETHMVAALSYSKTFDLQKRLCDASERLRSVGWKQFDKRYILAVVRARLELSIAEADASRTSERLKARPEILNESVDAIERTANFLRDDCCIPSPAFVPYSYQAVLISQAFFTDNGIAIEIRQRLRDWLWMTTYTSYFRGARDNDVASAAQLVNEIVAGTSKPAQPNLTVSHIPLRCDFRSARVKALAVRLAELRIKHNQDSRNEVLNMMQDQGAKCMSRLVRQTELRSRAISSPENRFLIASIDELKSRVSHQQILHFGGEQESLRVHAITADAAHAYNAGNFEQFLRLRRQEVLRLEADFVRTLGLNYDTIA